MSHLTCVSALTLALAAGLSAQTPDVAYFRAILSPANEVPPTPNGPTGAVDVIAHVVRDSAGLIVSGNVDFNVRATFPVDTTVTGLHIHSGPAGQNGAIVIPTNVGTGDASVAFKANTLTVFSRSVYVDSSSAPGAFDALRGLFTDSTVYYVNIHSTDLPGGVMRGQVVPAIATFLMAQMSSDNEVPSITNGVKASGVAQVLVLATIDKNNLPTSGEVIFSTSYNLSADAVFTGFHIHPGPPGLAGPVVIGSNLPTGVAASANVAGQINVDLPTELSMTNLAQVSALVGLFLNPGAFYINLHTSANSSGVMRAQLRSTERIVLPVQMDSANEVPAASVKATAPAIVSMNLLRNEDGSVAAGTVFFDINYRFPSGPVPITGLHIHDGKAGANGAVTIPMITAANSFTSDTGKGNFYGYTPPITSGAGLATLTDLVANPEAHYVNIHSAADPGGAIRSQLAPAVTAKANVAAVISLNQDKTTTTVAPGELVSVYGSNLSKLPGTLDGWQGGTLPIVFNGTSMTIGGKNARFYYVSPTQINAEVPVDAPLGKQQVLVDNGNGTGPIGSVTVAATAPAIFPGALILNTDGSQVTTTNPASGGSTVLVYCTGLGATSPALDTGVLVPATTIARTVANVTATIGGKDATVVYAIASPFYTGIYQVAIIVPSGLSGAMSLSLTAGNATATAQVIQVR